MMKRIAVTGLVVAACGLAGAGLAGVSTAAAEEVRQQLNAPMILNLLARPLETPEAAFNKELKNYAGPPKGDEPPTRVDVAPISIEAAEFGGFTLEAAGPAIVIAHESRIRQAVKMFFEGAANVLALNGREASAQQQQQELRITATGIPVGDDFELTKIFKFYYTDPAGNPDLSLATARLIAETYGGELNAWQESDKVTLRLSFPLGER